MADAIQRPPIWTDHLRYHKEEPCDCEPPTDALEELTRLARENGLSVSVARVGEGRADPIHDHGGGEHCFSSCPAYRGAVPALQATGEPPQ